MLFAAAWSGARAQFGSIADQPSDIYAGVMFPDGSELRAEFPEDLPWDTQVSVRGGYDSNVFTSKNDPISSLYANGAIGILYKFGTDRLQLETDLTAGTTYYFSRPGKKNDYNLDFTTAVNYAATQRLSFEFTNRISYLSQPDFYIAGTEAQRVGDYWYTTTELGMTFIIKPRLSSVTKYSYTTITYTDSVLNSNSGRYDQSLSESLQYLIFPTTKAILEARVSPTIYYEADFNTTGFSLLTGFDHQFNPRFTWNFRAGGEVRQSENPFLGQETTFSPNVSSILNYVITERTSLGWDVSYASEPTGGAFGASVRQTFRSGLSLSYGVTARLTANANIYYQHNYYEQSIGTSNINEDIFSGTLGLTFQITRNWTVNGVYQYISDSYKEIPDGGYQRNILYLGVNLLF